MNILKINLNTNSTYNDFKLKTKNYNKKIGFKGNNPGETIYPSCYNMSINQSSFLEEKIKNTLKYKKGGINTILADLFYDPAGGKAEFRKIANNPILIKYATAKLGLNGNDFEDDYIKFCINHRVENAIKFCQKKYSSQFIKLFSDRNIEEYDSLFEKIVSLTDIDGALGILPRLLNVKLPSGEYLYSEAGYKKGESLSLDELDFIVRAFRKNKEKYKEYEKCLELVQDGKIPYYVLNHIFFEGETNYNMLLDNNWNEIQEKDGKLTYNLEGKSFPLNMDKKTFDKLFPKASTLAISQGYNGNCYFVSTIFSIMNNPNIRYRIFQLFEQDGEDIVITIPDAKEHPIRYKDGKLEEKTNKNIRASLGIQLLENAYSKTRNIKYGIRNDIDITNGGIGSSVFDALLDGDSASTYSIISNKSGKKNDINKNIQRLKKSINEQEEELRICILEYESCIQNSKHINNIEAQRHINSLEKRIEYLKSAITEDYTELRNWFEISLNTNTVLSEKEFVSILQNTLSNNAKAITIASKSDSWLSWMTSIYPRHAYNISDYNPEDKTCKIINPYNTAIYKTETLKHIPIWFDMMYIK